MIDNYNTASWRVDYLHGATGNTEQEKRERFCRFPSALCRREF